jgi:hypothetical protein
MKEIDEILIDALVVGCFLSVLYIIDVLAVKLFPPEGPVFFRHTPFQFPLQWMIDAAHIGNFGAFLVRIVRRMWK